MRLRDLFRRRGRLVVFQGADDRWYWRHVARNGRNDDASEQGYATAKYARYKARSRYPKLTVEQETP